jgi:hypothetical protein
MAELNYDERKRVQVYEDLQAKRARGEYVSDVALENARTIADNMYRNAEARERLTTQLQAAEEAKQAARQAERDMAAQAAQDAYLREARLRYTGTEAQWQQDKDEILRQWRVRNALGGESLVERKRQQYGGML